MRVNNILILITLNFFLAASARCVESFQEVKIGKIGNYSLHCTQGDIEFKILAASSGSSLDLWGSEGKTKTIFEVTSVKRKGRQEMLVQGIGAYRTLSEVKMVRIDCSDPKWVKLEVYGGDASTAYKAIFEYDEQQLVKRKIVLSEFPSEIWEATTYSSMNLLNN